MQIWFFIKNKADFYLEKCRSGFSLKRKQREKKNIDLTLNKKNEENLQI